MASQPILKGHALKVVFGEFHAIDHVSVTLGKGEIAGPNGITAMTLRLRR
ncbi:hypothetical protein [Haematobacter massiliensis]|nr:hypothetical protein [Haematobacter massiliensis]